MLVDQQRGILEQRKTRRSHSVSHAYKAKVGYQQEMLEHINAIGSLLRLNLDIDVLLKQVTERTCIALRASKGVLYLVNSAAVFRLRAEYGISVLEKAYLRHETLQSAAIELLTTENFHTGSFYTVPATSALWQTEGFSSYFESLKETRAPFDTTLPQDSKAIGWWESETLTLVPLRRADASLFGLFICVPDDQVFLKTLEDMYLLKTLFCQVEVVIEGARMHEALRRSSEERAALIEIGRALSSPDALRDPQTVYQTIYNQVRSVMPTDAFFVSRYYDSPPSMWMEYLIDEEIVYPPFQYDTVPAWIQGILKREIPGLLFSTSEEYDTFTRTIYIADFEDIIGSSRPSQSLLFVPIHYGDEIIGMLSAQSYQQYAYTQHHMDVLREIAVQAGIALVNARVNKDLREAMSQAQESERLKNHFLMTASHELRTPLTSIQGYLELLGEYEATLSGEQKHRFVSLARRASEELVLLLGNVMDTSRLDQDRVLLKMERVQVCQPVRLIIEIFEPTIAREERSVSVDVDNTLYINADELRFRQVLLNLVGNALKYTPASTPINISAEQLAWHTFAHRVTDHEQDVLTRDGDAVVIAVHDKGDGIKAEEQKLLFARFMRLPNAMNSIQRGAGLGLYLCRELVEAMNGFIWIESSGVEGEGTTFCIALPVASNGGGNE